MIYLGNVSDTQTKTHVYNECKNFQDKYPHVDFFGVDRTSVDQISNRIRSSKVVIYYADIPPYTGLDVFFKLFDNFPDTTFYMLTLPADWTGIAEWPKNTHWLHYYFHHIVIQAMTILGSIETFNVSQIKILAVTKLV